MELIDGVDTARLLVPNAQQVNIASIAMMPKLQAATTIQKTQQVIYLKLMFQVHLQRHQPENPTVDNPRITFGQQDPLGMSNIPVIADQVFKLIIRRIQYS